METRLHPHLIMLGPAPETRSGIATQVAAWREQGLFRRWPIQYIATRADATPGQNAKVLANGVRAFGESLGRHGRVAVHVHVKAQGLWREAPFLAIAAAARCPLIVQLHGGGFGKFYDAAGMPVRAALRLLFERAACVAAPSESLRAWTRTVTRKAEAVCLPPAVALPPAAGGDKQNLVLFLGRLEAAKGIFDLVEALAQARASIPDLRLVCAGEGDRAAVARFAARLGIGDAVKFTGTVGPSGKRALFESAALLALPSYDEGLPLGLLEAMAAGLPVVAAPVGGIPEVLADGASGFFVAPGDKAALARLLTRLLADRALAARIGAAGRETVRLRCSPERSVARLEALYADLGLRPSADRAEPPPARQDMRQAA